MATKMTEDQQSARLRDRYNAGKTLKETEYGVKYPDGTTEWGRAWASRSDIRTAEGRAEFVAERERELERIHTPEVGSVIFLKRTITRKFSTPEILA